MGGTLQVGIFIASPFRVRASRFVFNRMADRCTHAEVHRQRYGIQDQRDISIRRILYHSSRYSRA